MGVMNRVSEPPPRHVTVAPVMRRPSAFDPAPGSWAVIGVGGHGTQVLDQFAAAGVPAIGYDPVVAGDRADVMWGHCVIAVEEIDDIDALAVTSRDERTHEITTEYVAGVAICVGAYDDWGFIDPETLNVCAAQPVLAHSMFTPRHPAIVVAGAQGVAGGRRQAEVIAAYAAALRDDPRSALTFHRTACARLLPGYPRLTTDPAAGEDLAAVLSRDLEALVR